MSLLRGGGILKSEGAWKQAVVFQMYVPMQVLLELIQAPLAWTLVTDRHPSGDRQLSQGLGTARSSSVISNGSSAAADETWEAACRARGEHDGAMMDNGMRSQIRISETWRVSMEPLAYELDWQLAWRLLLVSAVLEMAAVALFALNLAGTLMHRPAHLRHAPQSISRAAGSA